MKSLISLLTVLLLCESSFADIKLPAVFSDHMVLQQTESANFWGWASPNEQIKITAGWSNKTSTIKANDKGEWKVTIKTPKAGGPYTIKFSGKNTIEITDILIGEVWICSGQSNMVFSLKASYKAKDEIAKADFPNIRYFSVKRQYGPKEFTDCEGSVWQKTTPETAPTFSAVAYYFAKKIHQDIKVPVGIVYAAWGGTPAEAWAPTEVFKDDKGLTVYQKRWKDMYTTVGADSVKWHTAVDNWEKERKLNPQTKIKKPEEPATLVWYNRPWREPAILFNGMINPVIPFTIKGVLWYQGESNVHYADEYYNLFSNMIAAWRERWSKKELPFYFVQIAPYAYSKMDDAAKLREAQYLVSQRIAHTGMAVTVDLGEMKDQHFTRKKEVGERLALIAEAKDYGFKNLSYKGPEPLKASYKDGVVVLEFKTSAGLKSIGDTLKGFELEYREPIREDLSSYRVAGKANARIKGNTVILSTSEKRSPILVRYAWMYAGEANLADSAGLPAVPFRMNVNK